jgi:hypothetical protein
MSRSLSPAALKALFSTETSNTLITLLTVYDPINTTQELVRIADGYTQRIAETDRDVMYGVVSNSKEYIFLPLSITLPTDDTSSAPRCLMTITDVTKYVTPIIKSISAPPPIKLELVLSSTPDTIEASFPGFYITNFTYNADSVQADMSMINYAIEPFPAFKFTPQYFPGLF